MAIYQPSEDSYFFSDFLKNYLSKLKNKNIEYLEMGTGSGILAETASEFIDKKNILAVDINPEAITEVSKKGFNTIQSNLFSNLKNKKFDLITFNAPYLPEDKQEPSDSQLATTGGKRGDEISLKFLNQAKKHLTKEGKIFLLISSLTPLDKIKKSHPKFLVVAKKKLFFEELLVLEFSDD